MNYGYTGKIARINLSTRDIRIEQPDEIFYRTYIGGKGFIAYYLLKELTKGIDPLGPENKLIFACGIMTGLPVAGMPRYVVGAKSPLTGGFGQSEAGGFWGPELKKAGFDALIIEGKAAEPVYIYIHNGDVHIRDAKHLMGKETGEVQEIICKELGDRKVRIAQIGPAGEKLVKMACITNELKHFNGRNGLGAVMGSKNLRAVAVRGTMDIIYSDSEKIKEIGNQYLKMYMSHPLSRTLYHYGTSAGVTALSAAGILPTKNFIRGEFQEAERIGGDALVDKILKRREGCYACAIRCKRAVEVKRDDCNVDPKYGGPEYETLAAFGSLCEIGNIELIAKANEMCNRYGIDTIGTGASIAFAMECYERGILTKEDTEGIEITFGNENIILQLIEMIAKREGIGDLLAEGTTLAAKQIGNGAEECLLCVKGQELPMHDPRGKASVGIGYATSENSTDHMVAAHDGFFTQKGFTLDSVASLGLLEPVSSRDLSWKKIRMFVYLEQWWSFFNMAGICYFGPAPRGSMPIRNIVELLISATGWDTSLWEVMKAGERAINMARMFNVREGFSKKDDMLPDRLFSPLENGALEGVSVDKEKFEEAIFLYYAMMGWNEDGIPSRAKLFELNLDWL